MIFTDLANVFLVGEGDGGVSSSKLDEEFFLELITPCTSTCSSPLLPEELAVSGFDLFGDIFLALAVFFLESSDNSTDTLDFLGDDELDGEDLTGFLAGDIEVESVLIFVPVFEGDFEFDFRDGRGEFEGLIEL